MKQEISCKSVKQEISCKSVEQDFSFKSMKQELSCKSVKQEIQTVLEVRLVQTNSCDHEGHLSFLLIIIIII